MKESIKVLTDEYEEIIRCKKSFIVEQEDFLKGEWLKDVNKVFNYDKLDMVYKGNLLTIRFYKKKDGKFE